MSIFIILSFLFLPSKTGNVKPIVTVVLTLGRETDVSGGKGKVELSDVL